MRVWGIILRFTNVIVQKIKNTKSPGTICQVTILLLRIYLQAWNLTSGWKTATEVQNYITKIGAVMSLAVVNKYLDFNDYVTPIKSYIDDRYYLYLTPTFNKVSRIYLQQNEAVLNDDYLGISSASKHKYFNVEKFIIDNSILPSKYISFALMLGPSKNNYSRSVFTIMGLFGSVGGVYGLLQSIWGVLVGFVSSQIMLASVFRRLYYTNKTNVDNLAINIEDRSRRVTCKPIEENKEQDLKINNTMMKRIEVRPPLEVQIDYEDNNRDQPTTDPNNK